MYYKGDAEHNHRLSTTASGRTIELFTAAKSLIEERIKGKKKAELFHFLKVWYILLNSQILLASLE